MSDELPREAPEGAGSGATAPVARLAASQLRRVRRIVDAAVALAEKGGFDGVRLRDVAEASGVALGTLYKYFRSKEDILLFAVNEEAERLEAVMGSRPLAGDTALDRLESFFHRATRAFLRRPDFARAVLRAIASGEKDMAVQIAGFHLRLSRMIVAALEGGRPRPDVPLTEVVGSEQERELALVLQQVWFAAMVGWSGGLHPPRVIAQRVTSAAALMLDGASR